MKKPLATALLFFSLQIMVSPIVFAEPTKEQTAIWLSNELPGFDIVVSENSPNKDGPKLSKVDVGLYGSNCLLKLFSGDSGPEGFVPDFHKYETIARFTASILPSNSTTIEIKAKDGMAYRAYESDEERRFPSSIFLNINGADAETNTNRTAKALNTLFELCDEEFKESNAKRVDSNLF
ncbi:MAG: hypothetical protein IPM37_19110 [Hahellaceae bacterium]|nr:hypothetical protein [Hahellaceae bacterium]